MVFLNDHLPEHVHVIHGEKAAVFLLHCKKGPVTVRRIHGFSNNDIRAITVELTKHLVKLCRAWEKIHGYFEGAGGR